MANRRGERGHPCRTPADKAKPSNHVVAVEVGHEAEKVRWETDPLQELQHEALVGGGEGRSKIEKHTCPILLAERSHAHLRVDVHDVGQEGPAADEAPLNFRDPLRKDLL
eukprot:3319731-Pyramimonas_sp.AAC.1